MIISPPQPNIGNLVARWPFDGGVLLDGSGRGNHGTAIAGPIYGPGIARENDYIGNAITFNGTSQAFTVPTTNFALAKYTYCFWARSPNAPTSGGAVKQIFDGGGAWGFSWSHSNGAFTQAAFHQNASSAYFSAQLTSTLVANNWYHIAVTWDGASDLKICLNGMRQATTSGVASAQTMSGSVIFGAGNGGSTLWDGTIDDFRIYNVDLSLSAILDIYQEGLRGPALLQPRWTDATAAAGGFFSRYYYDMSRAA